MGEVRGPTIFYGICRGGPWSLKSMAHAVSPYRVAIDRYSRKAVPAVVDSPVSRGLYDFGEYRWDDANRWWEWRDDKSETID